MATSKYIFTVSNGQLLVELNNVSLDFDGDESKTYESPTLDLFKDTIRLLDFGIFVKSFKIENIETINLVVPKDIKDAFDLLLALLPNGDSSANASLDSIDAKIPPLMSGKSPVDIGTNGKVSLVGKQSDFSPKTSPKDDSVTQELTFDPDNNLKTRSSTLTDEGTFRINFSNSSLRVSIGTCTFTNGSKTVTGANFDTYDLHVGDYVNINGHSENTLVQIESLTLTEIILVSNYLGATTTGVASRQIIRSVTGAGSSITVGTGVVTIASQTTANSVTMLGRLVDIAPLIFREACSISQRIINQVINIGLTDDSATIKWYARFQVDGTTNTSIKCQTARNPSTAPSGNEIQETIVTIPNGLTTASSLEYRIELLTEEVVFYINEIRVARHTRVIPSQYDTMGAGIAVINGATPPASNTNVVIDYITCKNHNKLEVGIMSLNESIQSSQVPLVQTNYNVAGVIPINTDLLIIDCLQLRTINLQAVSIGTTGRLDFFLTNDLTQTGTAQPAYPIGGGTAVTTSTAVGHWNIPTNGARYLRIRLGVATTAGTTTLFTSGSPFAMPLPLITTQPVSGTLSTVTTVTGVTNAGTPTVPATAFFLNSAATTNGALISTGTSGLSAFYATNIGSTVAFVKLYNKATAPTVGSDSPEMTIPIPPAVAGVAGVANISMGFNAFRFPLGLGIAITGVYADADTTAVALNQVKVKISRTI